jgi:hypothetical protein
MPANFLDTLNEFTLESIALIALDTRLNVINGSDEQATQLYQVRRLVLKKLSSIFFKLIIFSKLNKYLKILSSMTFSQAYGDTTRHLDSRELWKI